jgi:hypothetical protein
VPERWLVISYWANCAGVTPSFHVDDRLPHLARAGVEAEVITSVCGPRPAGWGVRWHRVPSLSPSGVRFEMRHVARRLRQPWGAVAKTAVHLLVLPLYLLEKLLLRVDSTFWWWWPAGLLGTWWSGRRRPDLVYSTGGAVSGHLAAALIAAARRIPWIAEIRDPLPSQVLGRGALYARLLMAAERLIHRRATGVVYVTHTARARAEARAGGRCITIYAGAEPPATTGAPARGARLRLVHTGSLGGTRTPETVLAALARLAARRPEVRERVQLVFVGSVDALSRHEIGRFPYPEMVKATGKLPREAARELAEQADAVLLIQNQEEEWGGTIPAKTYEYLVAGRPLLGLLYHNPELASLLEEAGQQVAPVDEIDAIESALEDLYAQWESGRLATKPYGRYTRAGAAAELISWSRRWRGLAEEVEEETAWGSPRR